MEPPTLQHLVAQYLQQLKPQLGHLKPKKTHLSPYIDRQLSHLVVQQYFDFAQISHMLTYMFPEFKTKLSQKHCQQRWTQIHLNRKYKVNEAKESRQQKKLLSVMAFEDPKKMFTARELMEELEVEEKRRRGKEEGDGDGKDAEVKVEHRGFNITKETIRKKDEAEVKKLEEDLMVALEKAKEIDQDMCQKPFLYRPKFICDNFFELEKQDLTKQKATEIMSHRVMVNNYVVGQFTKTAVPPELPNFKSRFAHMNDSKTTAAEHPKGRVIQQNWSDYQSDSSTEK